MHAISSIADHQNDMDKGLALGTTSSNKANDYVRGKIEQVWAAAATGDYEVAFTHLGYAIQTLQDSTSPMHHGFGLWDQIGPKPAPSWGWAQPIADARSTVKNGANWLRDQGDGMLHDAQEIFTPADTSNFARATRDAIDWYVTGKVPAGNLFARHGADTKVPVSTPPTQYTPPSPGRPLGRFL